MQRIVSASRRTDIPAFYAEWFINRIHAGHCIYPNPLYPKTVYDVDLRPEAVSGIVFWTRHARPLMEHLGDLSSYSYYFQYTLLNYPKELDPRCPSLDVALATIKDLASQIGKRAVVWRYDPLVLTSDLTVDWHKSNFLKIAGPLSGHVERLVLSVVDPYKKTQRRLGKDGEGDVSYSPAAYHDLIAWIVETATGLGLACQSCAEPEIDIPNLTAGACIDGDLLSSLSGRSVSKALHKQREGCLCHQSVDIGVNDSCGFGCRYCYATSDHDKAMQVMKNHDPHAPRQA